MADPDELYTLRNYYYLGSYQSCINEGNTLNRLNNPALLVEKKEFVMRSYLGLNQIDLVLGELNENDAIYWLAIYLKEGSTSLDKCLEGLNNVSPPSIISSIIQGIIYTNENDIKNAMKLFYSCISTSLEAYSHYISLLLKMDRHDIALKEVNKMKSIDEDSTLTLLSEAWVILSGSSGNNNNNNSNSNSNSNSNLAIVSNTFEDLKDKFGASPLILNGLATSYLHQSEYESAETILLQSLQLNSNDTNTLANLIVCSYNLKKSNEVINRYLNQLKMIDLNHPLIKSLNHFESAYDRVSTGLKVNISGVSEELH